MGQATLIVAIESMAESAQQESCAVTQLVDGLQDLASQFEQFDHAALAFVSTTAAQSCGRELIDAASARLAIVDLCSRMLRSLETNDPFDFSEADEALMTLLFPPEPELPTSETATDAADVLLPSVEDNTCDPVGKITIGEESGTPGFEICTCPDEDLLLEFLNEATEHLETAEQLLLELEEDGTNEEGINGLFRAVHSVKGSSGVLEIKSLGEVSHLSESVLVRVRSNEIKLTGAAFEIVLIAVDFIKRQVDSVGSCFDAKKPLRSPCPPSGLIACLQTTVDTGTCPAEALAAMKAEAAPATKEQDNSAKKPQADSMRVDARRLEQLIDLIGELVITESGVQRELAQRESPDTQSMCSRLRKVVRDVQELSLSLKMVPVGTVLIKMNRMVRDLSARLDKPCNLEIKGGETEVDKTLLECIADPLVHLVRNSLDHGIETSVKDRIEAGKPEVATICVAAEHRGGNILIHIRDDGRGLNRDVIRQRAIEKCVISDTDNLTNEQIDLLIFEPGFSTAAEVSDISGRGVGMDVVRRNIESMRGSISIESNPGKGTTITLELPLTLSIIDGTVVRADGQPFIIPTLSVIEQVQTRNLAISDTDSTSMVSFRDHFIPLNQLSKIVGSKGPRSTDYGRICVIVESGNRKHALIVDEVLGQQPIVIKPLGGVLESFDVFAGGALLPAGEVAFVLDLNFICRAPASHPSHSRPSETNS